MKEPNKSEDNYANSTMMSKFLALIKRNMRSRRSK